MAKLADSGYDAMLINPVFNDCPRGASCDHEESFLEGRARFLLHQSVFLVDVSLFRIAPDALKNSIYNDGSWLLSGRLVHDRVLAGLSVENANKQ